MAPPEQRQPARLTRRQARDLTAACLLVVGGGGLLTVVYLWHVLAGAALTFALLIGAGIYLGADR